MGKFYRRADITHSTVLSQHYGDLSNNLTSAEIRSGAGNNAMLMSFDLDDTPPYGEANMTGLSLYMYASSVAAHINTSAPKLKYYKMNVDVGSNTSSVTSQDLNTYVMSSQPKFGVFKKEIFDGYGGTEDDTIDIDVMYIDAYNYDIKYEGQKDIVWVLLSEVDGIWEETIAGGPPWNNYNAWQMARTSPDGVRFVPFFKEVNSSGWEHPVYGPASYNYRFADEATAGMHLTDYTDMERIEQLGYTPGTVVFPGGVWAHHNLDRYCVNYHEMMGIPSRKPNRGDLKDVKIFTVDNVPMVNKQNSVFWTLGTRYIGWNTGGVDNFDPDDFYTSTEQQEFGVKYKISSANVFIPSKEGFGLLQSNNWSSSGKDDVAEKSNTGWTYSNFNTYADWDIQNTMAQTYNYPVAKLDAVGGIDTDIVPLKTGVAQVVEITWGANELGGASGGIADGDYIVLHDGDNRPHIFWFDVDGGGSAPAAADTKIYSGSVNEVDITTGGGVAGNAGALRTAIAAKSEFACGTLTDGVFTVTNDDNGFAEDPWDGGILGAAPTTLSFWVKTRGRGNTYEHNTGSKITLDVNFKKLGDSVQQYLTLNDGAPLANGLYTSFKRSFILWFGNTKMSGTGLNGTIIDYGTTARPPIINTIKNDKEEGESAFGWMFYRAPYFTADSAIMKVIPIIYNSGDVPTAASNTVIFCAPDNEANRTNQKGLFVLDEAVANHTDQQFHVDYEAGNLLEVHFDPEEGGAKLLITNQDHNILAVSHAPNNKKVSNGYEDAPAYMTLSTTNIGRVRAEDASGPNSAGEYESDFGEGHTATPGVTFSKSHESSMLIDSVLWSNYNYDVQSATMNNDNTITEGIKIEGGANLRRPYSSGGVDTLSVGDASVGAQAPSYISFGYSAKNKILDGNTHYQLWNGFVNSASQSVGMIRDENIRVGFIDDASRHGRYIGKTSFNDAATYEYGLGVNTDDEVVFTGSGYIRNFCMKGFVNYDVDAAAVGPSSGNRDIVKRENHLVAGRVIKIDNIGRNTVVYAKGCRWANKLLTYDTTAELTQNTSQTDNYYSSGPWGIDTGMQKVRLYEYGKPYTTSYYNGNLTPHKVSYDLTTDITTFTFYHDIKKNDAGADWITAYNVHNKNIWISPEAFWVIWQILPYNPADEAISQRLYSAVCPVSGDSGMVGMSWNESSVSNDYTVGTLYSNRWALAKTGGAIYEQNTDYGYGVYIEPTDTEPGMPDGGYCGIEMISEGVYNPILMDGLVDSGDVQPDMTLGLLGQAHDPNLINRITVDLAGGTNAPFILQTFEDEVPEPIIDFKATPNEDNPFLVDFTWTADAEDLWYGFLQIGDTTLDNQYTNSLAHIPLNEDGSKTPAASAISSNAGIIQYQLFTLSNSVIKAYDYANNTSYSANALGASVTNDIEGLSGYAKRFTNSTTDITMNTSYIEFDNSDIQTGGGYSNWSIVVHIIPDDKPALDEFIISKEGEYDIWLDTSGQVNARVFLSDGVEAAPNTTIPPVELRGTAIIPMDATTPTCIILTVDANLRANNVKLFINGKIEDQSGLALSSGTSNNWQIDSVIANTTAHLNIGRKNYATLNPTSAKNAYDGLIEEIVIYGTTLYPISPANNTFTLNPLHNEMTTATSGSSKSYVARLFMKDYHNIRGKTRDTVCASGQISFRKAGFSLDTS